MSAPLPASVFVLSAELIYPSVVSLDDVCTWLMRCSSPSVWVSISEAVPRRWNWLRVILLLFMCEPPMVMSSVGTRLPFLLLDRCELPNWLETFMARGRSVGRHAQITPHAVSTTHQVHAVARVPVACQYQEFGRENDTGVPTCCICYIELHDGGEPVSAGNKHARSRSVFVFVGFKGCVTWETHKLPSIKVQSSEIFCRGLACRFQTCLIGIHRIARSVTMLGTALPMNDALRLIHVPFSHGIHAT
jgi:hypothetical protein